MQKDLNINISGYSKQKVRKNTTIKELVNNLKIENVMSAKIDGEFLNLNQKLLTDCNLQLIKVSDKAGHRMYVSALKFILIVAVQELFGREAVVYVKHSIDKGTYCEIDIDRPLTDDDVEKIKIRMLEYVDRDLPIEKVSADKFSAVKHFKSVHEYEKAENASETINDNITLYKLFDYYNYFYVDLPLSTGPIKIFDLKRINDSGLVLMYPEREDPSTVPPYIHFEKIFNSFENYNNWLELIDTTYVSDLNDKVSDGNIEDLIRMNEIRYDNQLMTIVDEVIRRKDKLKVLLLGGPSSSGKTTSSKKLGLYLKSAGLNPLVLSVDDYFVERDDTPKDANGNFDFECLEAIDIQLFNDNLSRLTKGEEIMPPRYNFYAGKKEYDPKLKLKLKNNGIIIIEGLHCINEKLTEAIDKENKYKIYISPFNALTIDRHNHISTVDMRFLRRMVRDNLFRGYGPEHTLKTWKSVRSGEKKYLFPHLQEADFVLNTAMIYEIGVLKVYASPLLYSIKPSSPHYEESRRILNFLNSFFPIPSEFIPNDSILREFIGGSYFNK